MRKRSPDQLTPGPAERGAQAPPGSGSGSEERRLLRPRSAQLNFTDQHPLLDAVLGGDEEEEGVQGQRRRLDIPLLCSRVERAAPAQPFTAATHPAQVTAEALLASGLRQPLLVPSTACGRGGVEATRAALGLQLPPAEQLTPRGLAAAVGPDHRVGVGCAAWPCLALRGAAPWLRSCKARWAV